MTSRRKLAFVLAGVALAGVSSAHAAVMAFRVRTPGQALAVMRTDPVALAGVAQALLPAAAANAAVLPKIAPFAKASLRAQGLNPPALRLLAISRASSVQRVRAQDVSLLRLAHQMSRRDLLTEALLVEESARRGDMKAALATYDTILRVRGRQREQFFAALRDVLKYPEAAGFARFYFEQRPPWLSPFLAFASTDTDIPSFYADMVLETGGLDDLPDAEIIGDRLIARLIDLEGDYAKARRVYLAHSGAQTSALTSPAVTAASTADQYNRLLWQFYVSEDWGSEHLSGSALLAYSDIPGPTIVARKLLALEPGKYELRARLEQSVIASGGAARIDLWCEQRKPEEATLLARREIAANTTSSSVPFVAGACRSVRLDLALAGGVARQETRVLFTDFSLARSN